MMAKLRRDDRIKLFMIGHNNFEVRNKEDDVLIDSNDSYFIYMKNVNFKGGNLIEGRYLGEMDANSPLLDKHCLTVSTDGESFKADGDKIKTARMVAVNNKENVIVIISN